MWVAGIALAYCLLALFQSYATRPGAGPDEPAHLIYVQSLALDGRIPNLDGSPEHYAPGAAVSHQAQHPPLYYAIAAAVYRLASVRGDLQGYRVLRLLSVAIGLGVLAFQWRLSGLVFKQAHLRLASVATLAFLPMFTYIMAVVNNDCLAVLCSAAALDAILRSAAQRRGWWGPICAGLWVAAGVATKESALALLPVAAAGMLLPREGLRFRSRLAQACVAVAIGLIPALAWWWRNLLVHGTPFVYAYVQPIFPSAGEALAKPGAAIYMLFLMAWQTFAFLWAPWWDLKQHVPAVAYLSATGLISTVGVVGLLLYFVDTVKRRPTAQAQVLPVLLLAALVVVVSVGIARYTLFVDYRALQGGRYLIVAWPALAVLVPLGFGALMGRAARIGLAIFCALWLLWDAVCVFLVGRTYSAW
jgi:4-amino-4-deoxy-L-arabinose transferase-like glycosyltransferase